MRRTTGFMALRKHWTELAAIQEDLQKWRKTLGELKLIENSTEKWGAVLPSGPADWAEVYQHGDNAGVYAAQD